MTTEPEDREDYGPACAPVPFERGTDGPRLILVGVDGTRTSMRAAAYAGGLARRQRCRLVVVFVAAPSLLQALAPGAATVAQEQAFDEFTAELREQLRERSEEYGVTVTFLRRRGDPYTELRNIADELRADMVVVGSSSQAGHRLIGSMAARLIRTGRWPVVVVP